MEEKQINKWLRRRFSPLGWTLVVYFAMMNALVAAAMALDAAGQTLEQLASGHPWPSPDVDALMGNAWGYIYTIAAGAAVLYAWKGPQECRALLQKRTAMRPGTFAALACLCIGSQMVNSLWVSTIEWVLNRFGLSMMGMLERVSGASDTASMFVYSALLAPVAEEVLFRGLILRTLEPFGRRFAIFGSAVLFGLFHGNLLQTPYAFLMGLLLGYTALEYAMGWAIGLHLFNNLVLADLLTRLTTALPEPAASAVDLAVFGGGAAGALVLLVLRRRQVRAYRRSQWMDRRCVKCFFLNGGVLTLTALMLGNIVLSLFV